MAIIFSIRELRELSEQLTKETQVAFDQMSPSYLKRRLHAFSEKKGLKKTEQLIDGLRHEEFKDDLLFSMSVPVTELFRDAGVWRNIREHLIQLSKNEEIKVWLPHVSSGEELYTLLIIAKEIGVWDQLKVIVGYCSSITKDSVEKGLIQKKNMEMNLYNYKRFEGKSNLELYLDEENGSIKLKKELLSCVEFRKGLVLKGQPDEKVDMVLFRNIMLYFKKDYHSVFKEAIDTCLKPDGWLCVGVKERLPSPFSDRFECVDVKEKIYVKYKALTD